jgi:hypothetical protein
MMVLESCSHAVVGEQGVQKGTKHALLKSPRVGGQRGLCCCLPSTSGGGPSRSPGRAVVGGAQSQGPELIVELGGHYGVER